MFPYRGTFYSLVVLIIILGLISILSVPRLGSTQVVETQSSVVITADSQPFSPRVLEMDGYLTAGDKLVGNVTIQIESGSASPASFSFFVLNQANFEAYESDMTNPPLHWNYYSGSNVNSYGESTIVFPVNLPINSTEPYYFIFFYPSGPISFSTPSINLNDVHSTIVNETTSSSYITLPFSPEYLGGLVAILGVFVAVVHRREMEIRNRMKKAE